MKNKTPKTIVSFQQAVNATPDISAGYRTGLTALGTYSNRIDVSDSTKLQGSVDIDLCTQAIYPQENRWDYAMAYKSEVYFIEVHSANTSEVKVVIKKLQWLKNWLQNKAPRINALKAKGNTFVWIQSKNFQIPKNTPQYRLASSSGVLPLRKFKID